MMSHILCVLKCPHLSVPCLVYWKWSMFVLYKFRFGCVTWPWLLIWTVWLYVLYFDLSLKSANLSNKTHLWDILMWFTKRERFNKTYYFTMTVSLGLNTSIRLFHWTNGNSCGKRTCITFPIQTKRYWLARAIIVSNLAVHVTIKGWWHVEYPATCSINFRQTRHSAYGTTLFPLDDLWFGSDTYTKCAALFTLYLYV